MGEQPRQQQQQQQQNQQGEAMKIDRGGTTSTADHSSSISCSPHQPVKPHGNDILLGRGGFNNRAHGNETLRRFARAQVSLYRSSSKHVKSQLVRQILQQMRELDPPAR